LELGRDKDLLYLPVKNYEIASPFSSEEVKERLTINTEIKMPLFSLCYSGGKKFTGKIGEDNFLISRIIRYNNSFLPVIEGVIYPSAYGSKIHITMRLNKFVLGFWVFWMSMVLLVTIVLLQAILLKQKFENLIPLLMLLFGYFLCIIPFNFEVNKAKRILDSIINPTAGSIRG
jgi:hypothetical protein